MFDERGDIEVETLLKVVLVLVAVLLVLEIVGFLVSGIFRLLGPFSALLQLLLLVLIVLWLLDRI